MRHCKARSRPTPPEPQSFLDGLRHFLTPQLYKQVQAAWRPAKVSRWPIPSLLFVLLVMTWCTGDSLAERFETATAFYIACHQRKRRPGKTVEGFHKAWARVPMVVLNVVADALRRRLAQVFANNFTVDGFVPFGCDGSTLNCPRSAQLQQRLRGQNNDEAPQVYVTALVHLSLGLLWSWRLGSGGADEREHLRQLLTTLPAGALLVTDAGFPGYALLQTLLDARCSFLMRLSSCAPLYAPQRIAVTGFREGLVYYWPKDAQDQKLPPLPVRLLRLYGRKADVWLITNVLDSARLTRARASTFYRWRWRNEGLFRFYKRTLGKVKLMSRTVALVHREAAGSLLAVQLLLAQGSLALCSGAEGTVVLGSARQVLLAIREEIRNVTGMYLGPRQRATFRQRLHKARGDRHRRRHRPHRERQPWPGRRPHKPPGRPTIRTMGNDLKKLLAETLQLPSTDIC